MKITEFNRLLRKGATIKKNAKLFKVNYDSERIDQKWKEKEREKKEIKTKRKK